VGGDVTWERAGERAISFLFTKVVLGGETVVNWSYFPSLVVEFCLQAAISKYPKLFFFF
jgi:hypothetical protein